MLRCEDEIGAGLVTRACVAGCIVHHATKNGTRYNTHHAPCNELPSTAQLARTQHGHTVAARNGQHSLHPQLHHATCGHCTAVAQPLMCRCHRQRALWSRATDTSRAPAPDRPIRTPPHAPIGLHARCLAAISGSLTRTNGGGARRGVRPRWGAGDCGDEAVVRLECASAAGGSLFVADEDSPAPTRLSCAAADASLLRTSANDSINAPSNETGWKPLQSICHVLVQ